MAMWKNDDEMFALMKEKLYTPVVGDILDQMGYKHQFLPASIRPLAAQVPTAPYILPGEEEDKRLKVAGYACTVLENDVFEYPAEKPFGYMTEALDDLKPNEIYIATGAHNSALWGELLTACGKARGAVGAVLDGYTRDTPKVISHELITEVSLVGGILITASGLGILHIKDCKTINLLPALFMPILFFALRALCAHFGINF